MSEVPAAALLAQLIGQLPIVVYRAALDARSTTLFVSEGIEAALGIPRDAFLHNPGEWVERLYPEDRERVRAEVLHAQITGEPLNTAYRMLRADGTPVWFRDRAILVRGVDGAPDTLLGVMLDITEQQLSRQLLQSTCDVLTQGALERARELEDSHLALRANEERLRAIVNTAVDGIITIDERGIIDSFNPVAERMFGYQAAEVLGTTINRLMPMPYSTEHDGYLSAYIETRIPRIIGIGREVVGLRKDGSVFPMDLAVSGTQQGEHWLFTGIVRDITERRLLRAQQAQQEKLVAAGQLAAGIAHEVGNPLASISALVQTVGRRVQDPVLADKLKLALQHIERISNILRRMVDFARPAQTEWRRCSIHQILSDALAIVRYDRRARRTAIELELADDMPQTVAMPDLLSQMFVNLALNAFDALEQVSPDRRPMLRIATRVQHDPQGARLEIVCTDNGPGIPSEVEARILEPFFTTKDVGKGTGLGLSVCHSIVREHGGRLTVEGRPGLGARFTIELPVRATAPDG